MATTTTIVTNAAWSNLGAGPLSVQAIDNEVFIAISASTPSALGSSFVLRPRDGRQDINAMANIYAMSAAVSGSAIVESATVTA